MSNSRNVLRALIKKDIKKLNESNAVSVQAKSDLLDSIADLMKAIEEFKEEAPAAALSHIGQTLNELQEKLIDISERPDSFVMAPKQAPKKVTFKPTNKTI
jgi:hypothetical protein